MKFVDDDDDDDDDTSVSLCLEAGPFRQRSMAEYGGTGSFQWRNAPYFYGGKDRWYK